jgi:tetratricopeptide (TPR) repeat protein
MKYFLLFIFFIATNLHAQNLLNFDKRFVESEDKWVAFQMDKDSSYSYGFIYIDEEAGLTLNHEGTFVIKPTGTFVPKKFGETNIKVRLQPNNILVAFIPESKFQELKIQSTPEWLKHYKTDTNSVARLYRWGFMYNGWEECAKALTFLEKAEKTDPDYKGLAVELSFSYNCLKQYDKAEKVLEAAMKANATDAYVNKEYIFTLAKNNKVDKATEHFYKSIKTCKDNTYNAENCYNILQQYYLKTDKENFNKWYKELQKYPNENKMLTQYADNMKRDIDK